MVTVKKLNGRIKGRINPTFKKLKKSITLSRWLLLQLEDYAKQLRISRSQAIERICSYFFNTKQSEILLELSNKKIEVAMLEQKIKNIQENKKLVEFVK